MNRLERENVLRLFEQLHQNDDAYWRRASGSMYCSICGLQYRHHPPDMETPLVNEAYDNRLCNGTIVHT
jgi:hypothetical protein